MASDGNLQLECMRIVEEAIALCDASRGEVGAYEAVATRMAACIAAERERVRAVLLKQIEGWDGEPGEIVRTAVSLIAQDLGIEMEG